MNLTLLLDLDDTLLGNPQKVFIPAYISALAKRFAPFAAPEKMVPTLLTATQQMMNAGSAARSLQDTFSAAFYPALGLDPTTLIPILDDFYAQDYPKLRPLTHRQPEAEQLVAYALARGFNVAIATSPLFPRTATLQRLEWAGFPADQYPFKLISTYETFHFAKPSPAYFAEFLGQMGWPDGPVLMVGDDIEMDILPAQECGLPVFWTPVDAGRAWDLPAAPPPQGDLLALREWLDKTPVESLVPNLNTPAALKTILRATPAALDTLSARIGPEAWNTRPAQNEWCPAEIICHLRDVENEVNLARVERCLSEDNPFISGENTDPWAEERGYIRQSLPEALRAFGAHRARLLSILEPLPPQDWQRPIRHAIFGPTTFQELVRIIMDHDRIHIQQIFTAEEGI